jgi:tetratricopeptide (TPR) repeat protein
VEVGFALCQLGHIEWIMGDYDEAKSLLQESLAIGKETGDWFIMYLSLIASSYVALSLGTYGEAKKLCLEGIVLCREVSNRRGEVFMVNHLAWVANARGDYAEAKQWLQETLINDFPASWCVI